MLWKKWLEVLRRARVPEARTAVLYFLEDIAKREGVQPDQNNEEFKVGNREVSVLQPRPSVQSRLLTLN